MKEWFEKHVSHFLSLFLIFLIVGCLVFFELENKKGKTKQAMAHIDAVMTVDRNCNDCHLGMSFVKLFNHPAVKGNDNTVNLMMDKAKIKRW